MVLPPEPKNFFFPFLMNEVDGLTGNREKLYGLLGDGMHLDTAGQIIHSAVDSTGMLAIYAGSNSVHPGHHRVRA